MITITDISSAPNFVILDEMINNAAWERGAELAANMTYIESAEFFESEIDKAGNGAASLVDLVDLLNAAEQRAYSI